MLLSIVISAKAARKKDSIDASCSGFFKAGMGVQKKNRFAISFGPSASRKRFASPFPCSPSVAGDSWHPVPNVAGEKRWQQRRRVKARRSLLYT